MKAPCELNVKKRLSAALGAGALAFSVPWLLMILLQFMKWLGSDIDPSADGAWLGSYFLSSIVSMVALVSFGTNPRSSFRNNFFVLVFVALTVGAAGLIAQGPRVKSEPPFGEKLSDLLLLTAPAFAGGVSLLAWRTLRGSRHRQP